MPYIYINNWVIIISYNVIVSYNVIDICHVMIYHIWLIISYIYICTHYESFPYNIYIISISPRIVDDQAILHAGWTMRKRL